MDGLRFNQPKTVTGTLRFTIELTERPFTLAKFSESARVMGRYVIFSCVCVCVCVCV